MIEALKRYLGNRRRAYQRVFGTGNPDAVVVMQDLARFCRAYQTTVTSDARASAVLEGRREVWLRIQQHLQLDEDTLWQLYHGRTVKEPDNE